MSLEPGTTLGPYAIVSLLGRGGMGEVYRARDTRLGREVAVKVLPEELSGDERFRRRFQREARTISQLQHPHVCTLHDIGLENGMDYLVLELLEGETLQERLGRGPLPIDEVKRVGGAIAEALDAAHRRGIVHRDLKPGNVMLTEAGLKVVDFGLARSVSAEATHNAETLTMTGDGEIVGTLPYMAPEQLKGREADPRSDMFALGCGALRDGAPATRPFRGDRSRPDVIGCDPGPPSLGRMAALRPGSSRWRRTGARQPRRSMPGEKDPEEALAVGARPGDAARRSVGFLAVGLGGATGSWAPGRGAVPSLDVVPVGLGSESSSRPACRTHSACRSRRGARAAARCADAGRGGSGLAHDAGR